MNKSINYTQGPYHINEWKYDIVMTDEGYKEALANARLLAASFEMFDAPRSAAGALEEAQGEWALVSEAYAPISTHAFKSEEHAIMDLLAKIEGVQE